jgi:hypothetical protein
VRSGKHLVTRKAEGDREEGFFFFFLPKEKLFARFEAEKAYIIIVSEGVNGTLSTEVLLGDGLTVEAVLDQRATNGLLSSGALTTLQWDKDAIGKNASHEGCGDQSAKQLALHFGRWTGEKKVVEKSETFPRTLPTEQKVGEVSGSDFFTPK